VIGFGDPCSGRVTPDQNRVLTNSESSVRWNRCLGLKRTAAHGVWQVSPDPVGLKFIFIHVPTPRRKGGRIGGRATANRSDTLLTSSIRGKPMVAESDRALSKRENRERTP